jgi:pSer/pThr/pTyr-binding forkhead associated (FHA) protein
MPLKGAPGEMLLGELVWRDAIKPIAAANAAASEARVVLRVTYSGKTLTRRRQGDSLSIGRDAECDLRVEGAKVSRRHCRLVLRGPALVLLDESSNGSFVAVPGKAELHVHGGELALPASGRIGLGQPCSAAGEVVTYACG